MYLSIYIYNWTSKSCIFLVWFGLKSSERPKIEQLLILPSVSHIWKNHKYNAKWRRKDAKDRLFDTKTVSLNPSLLAQKWLLGPHPKIHKDRKLCGSRTVQVCMYIYIYSHTGEHETNMKFPKIFDQGQGHVCRMYERDILGMWNMCGVYVCVCECQVHKR